MVLTCVAVVAVVTAKLCVAVANKNPSASLILALPPVAVKLKVPVGRIVLIRNNVNTYKY
jgi:hypothetical protein